MRRRPSILAFQRLDVLSGYGCLPPRPSCPVADGAGLAASGRGGRQPSARVVGESRPLPPPAPSASASRSATRPSPPATPRHHQRLTAREAAPRPGQHGPVSDPGQTDTAHRDVCGFPRHHLGQPHAGGAAPVRDLPPGHHGPRLPPSRARRRHHPGAGEGTGLGRGGVAAAGTDAASRR